MPHDARRCIALGGDHRGAAHLVQIARHLAAKGYDTVIHSDTSGASCDYPDGAAAVGRDVAHGKAWLGIVVCGSGNGVCITANKVRGIRAALAVDVDHAAMARAHNDANVLCLSGDRTSPTDAPALVDAFLAAEFEGGRHARRVDKMTALEAEECGRTHPV
jgi:ribose 5-phosphate isomerase B